uniref:Receptor-type tyrosine-protein phosphatase O n=1 Tax=Schistosoma japonicum TaxID=6182 RepID=C1LIC4_SCHJA|nr:Receptor-type tyrosine-protein phosphatase O precursor [Schistosoma japonicum]
MNFIYDLPERLLTVKSYFQVIGLSKFKQYLDDCLTNTKLIFDEFQKVNSKSDELQTVNQLTFHAAVHPQNYYLNRYDDILPYDQTRTILKKKNDQNSIQFSELSTNFTDYINANFIRTIEPLLSSKNDALQYTANNHCEFIATQGPLKQTIGDFWYMIYLFKCPFIVMLTGLHHNGQIICDLYWPEKFNTPISYKCTDFEVSVTLLEVNQSNCFVKRIFQVSVSNESIELSHNVTQIHFTEWENFSIPTIRNMHELVEEYEKDYQLLVNQSTVSIGPTVVHCSAGVGRTGTFISVLVVRRHLRSACDFISIPSIVLMLRIWRCCMVELKEQYLFLHEYFAHILTK